MNVISQRNVVSQRAAYDSVWRDVGERVPEAAGVLDAFGVLDDVADDVIFLDSIDFSISFAPYEVVHVTFGDVVDSLPWRSSTRRTGGSFTLSIERETEATQVDLAAIDLAAGAVE